MRPVMVAEVPVASCGPLVKAPLVPWRYWTS